ncbi:bifunctional diaminohydroxyphosphoribosylaminopyrimidine deaminase/5-amino-6-(5-phosphoribosylamino)uracil reductase RibD [Desulfosudis oleivorans]|uniref:Riboflavin biosynthesis protein RibD n=1 Tax=Desulfosudis oleivorans (strain DSM 6200 / JCM 39069 / Hxd3) TaxID=96561 RepID=A8ZTV0_DESOH|nr:bifunctional diaminohydroxyphosphoribosylaminopyrimidine deaminase/5-amino-6-(5-phosphoribosylamino)uracil reductase RibD [Desulfosudis oleivorans]ABW67883.1 riboflavin biosynthesis protein RibD [Desulfosudis oleivorans Hxd3]
MDDTYFMNMALGLAERGTGFTSPNPVVGAVVVRDGRVVGQGFHAAAGKPHAEVVAIDDAGELARGADLYVTLEPCNHTGRTPPCTRKICDAGIARVVVATIDSNPHVAGGGIQYLESRGIAVTVGVCEAEAKKQIEWFAKYVTTGRPFVTVKCAMTLDGRIATRTGDSKWVTGEAARAFVHRMRHASDAILVGVGTANADNPRLTARVEGMRTRDPMRIVLDTKLSIREDAAMFDLDSSAETLIVVGPGHDKKKRDRLKGKARFFDAALAIGRIDMAGLMDGLGKMGITSLLIEGGGQVIGAAFAAGIVDKVCFFYAPKILGGDDGVPVCAGAGQEQMKNALPVRNVSVTRFDDDILIEGYVS